MKRLLLAGLVAGAILAPTGAFATHPTGSCGYASTQEQKTQVAPGLWVYADTNGGGGTSGTADQSAGVCLMGTGSFEAGHSATKGSNRSPWYTLIKDGFYFIADGGSSNPDPADGYAGVSNYETGTTTCSNNVSCTGSNGGGSFGAPGGPYAPVYVPVACGNTTGPQWDNSKRDGCEVA